MTLAEFLEKNARCNDRAIINDGTEEWQTYCFRLDSSYRRRAEVTSAEKVEGGLWRVSVDLSTRGFPFDRKRIINAFAECKREAGLDFARTAVDSLGDCATCVWDELCDRYGDDCHGIFLKHWSRGMNGAGDLEEQDRLCIAHDLTEEQAAKVLAVLGRYFVLESTEYDKDKCFVLLGQKAGV